MARRRAHKPLNVFLNGRLAGLPRRESSGAIDFQYAREWLDWGNTFPVPLSLPLREDRYIGARVINMFDNLLPDSDPVRRWVAETAGADGTGAYSLLSAPGHDCAGAPRFLPDGVEPGAVGDTAGRPVSDDEVSELIRNLATSPLGAGDDEDFRISIAGTQEKTALLRHQGQWFKPAGTTATTHLLKPRIGQLPNGVDLSNSVENEYLCLKLMEGLDVPAAKAVIADFDDRRTLIVERFDRRWTRDARLAWTEATNALGCPGGMARVAPVVRELSWPQEAMHQGPNSRRSRATGISGPTEIRATSGWSGLTTTFVSRPAVTTEGTKRRADLRSSIQVRPNARAIDVSRGLSQSGSKAGSKISRETSPGTRASTNRAALGGVLRLA
jgi:HipA-like protein